MTKGYTNTFSVKSEIKHFSNGTRLKNVKKTEMLKNI